MNDTISVTLACPCCNKEIELILPNNYFVAESISIHCPICDFIIDPTYIQDAIH
jgi:hypothetical protein